MNELEKIVNEVGREYVEKRIEIEESWQSEFDTKANRNIKEKQIEEVHRIYREKLREKKIEHLLHDTLYRE